MSLETKKLPQYIAGALAAGGAFCLGQALGWSSPAARRLVDEGQYFPITTSEWSWIASIVTIGCAVSCVPIGYLLKKFGRKWTMLGLYLPFIIGWILIIWAQNFVMLLIGRFLLGLAGGAFCIASPQYSAEIAEKEIRGTIAAFFQLLIALGILYPYVVGAYVSVFVMNIICGIWPIIFGIAFFFMPESPTYLIVKNKEEEAAKALKWLRGSFYNTENEITELKANFATEMSEKVPFKTVIKQKSSIVALVIGLGLLFHQQMSAINIVLFYTTTIFEAAGVGLSPDISTIIIGVIQLFSSLMGCILIDKLGRRILLLFSVITMTITLTTLGVFFFIQSKDSEAAGSLGWLPLTSLCIYILAFPVGYGGIPWIVVSEIAPRNFKEYSGPVIGCFNWTLGFIVASSFQSATNLFGTGVTFWIFAGVTSIGILFTYFVVPETKGKSLAEIESSMNKPSQAESNNSS